MDYQLFGVALKMFTMRPTQQPGFDTPGFYLDAAIIRTFPIGFTNVGQLARYTTNRWSIPVSRCAGQHCIGS
jgi:hypothetical protein